ncbi:MAG: MBL fold metallo-hydrolase [Synechococcaceae cyanobacterium]
MPSCQAGGQSWSDALAAEPPLQPPGRPPTEVRPGLWLFAPHRDTRGGSAWLLSTAVGDVLVDCPAANPANLAFLEARRRRGQQGWITLTGRDGHGPCRQLQRLLDWPVLVQEQEAFLLPNVERLRAFGAGLEPAPGLRLLWTPGPSPGACVLLCRDGLGPGTDLLFCGRLLVPLAPGRLQPLRRRLTFHWPRQLASLEALCRWLPPGSPAWIATGAALGALRGEALVGPEADRQLRQLDLAALASHQVDPADLG